MSTQPSEGAVRAAKYTPGPWSFGHACVGGYCVHAATIPVKVSGSVERAYYQTLTVATQRDPHPLYGGGISHAQAEANAHLIAAAPDLLAALTEIFRVEDAARAEDAKKYGVTALSKPFVWEDQARAAIAKATPSRHTSTQGKEGKL